MQRTQVYLPKEMLDQLRREAYEKKTSLAEIIRRKVMSKNIGWEKTQIKKKVRIVEEIAKIDLRLPNDWQKIKKIILEAHSPFHEHKT